MVWVGVHARTAMRTCVRVEAARRVHRLLEQVDELPAVATQLEPHRLEGAEGAALARRRRVGVGDVQRRLDLLQRPRDQQELLHPLVARHDLLLLLGEQLPLQQRLPLVLGHAVLRPGEHVVVHVARREHEAHLCVNMTREAALASARSDSSTGPRSGRITGPGQLQASATSTANEPLGAPDSRPTGRCSHHSKRTMFHCAAWPTSGKCSLTRPTQHIVVAPMPMVWS